MTNTRKFSLLSMLLAVVLCLSAITVAVVSADGTSEPPALKTTAEFKTADAVEGKVTLTDMAPGIYQVAVKGKTPAEITAHANFGFIVDETTQGYSVRVNKSVKTFDSGDAFVNCFAAELVEGTNTLSLKADATIEITDYSLTLVQAYPLAAEEMAVNYNAVTALKGNWYVKVDCAVADHKDCTGVHYYKATSTEARKWTYNASGVAGTDYFLSINDLPENCYIRDCTGTDTKGNDVDETTQAFDFGNNYTYGENYSKSNTNTLVSGSIFYRAKTTIKMTVDAPKAGTYKLYSIYSNTPALSISVNGGETAAITLTKTGARGTGLDNNSSGNHGNEYADLGTVTLVKGKNTVLLEHTGGNFLFSGLEFVHEHEFGTTFEKDATHHWSSCVCGTESEKIAHTGYATFEKKATCSACGQEFGGLLKNEATFLTADAVDGKIVLADMAPGIYTVAIKGSATAKKEFGFYIEETHESFLTRGSDNTFSSTDAFTDAFPAILTHGTNTLILHAGTGVTITDYKLTKIQELPLVPDGMSTHYSFVPKHTNQNYVMTACPGTGCSVAEAHTVHYRKATGGYSDQWDPTGVFYTKLSELPADCYIRDCSSVAESAGKVDFGTSNSYGPNYSNLVGGNRGSLFVRQAVLKLTVTVPKAGSYKLTSVLTSNNNNPQFTFNVNGQDVESPAAEWIDPSSTFHPGSQQSAAVYGSLGTLDLVAGDNVIVITSNNAWVQFSGIEFVHEHDYVMQSNETQHWGKCACGAENAKVNHTTPADDGDCTTAIVCPDCQYVLTAAKEHTGGTATCTAKAVCTNAGCGKAYGSMLEHEYTVAQKDATQHWNKCANCDAIDEKVDHAGGTATCQAKAVCATCQAEYGELAAHTYEQKSDETKHWKECSLCQDKIEEAEHVYGEDKKCACGLEKTGCGASIAASAVAVTAILGLGIGFIRKKKED